jgi:hypothetical protein
MSKIIVAALASAVIIASAVAARAAGEVEVKCLQAAAAIALATDAEVGNDGLQLRYPIQTYKITMSRRAKEIPQSR